MFIKKRLKNKLIMMNISEIDDIKKIPSDPNYIVNRFNPVYVSYFPTYVYDTDVKNYNDFIAIREIIMNALDEEERSNGYGIVIDKNMMDAIIIKNHGRGITIDTFITDGADKECWQRGLYGDGLKYAFAYLNRFYKTYLINDKFIFKPYYDKKNHKTMLYMLIGHINNKIKGSEIHIIGSDVYKIKKIIKSVTYHQYIPNLLRNVSMISPECRIPRNWMIINIPDMLYVGDMYVNKISKITGTYSPLSYNIWHVPLTKNYTNVQNIRKLNSYIDLLSGFL